MNAVEIVHELRQRGAVIEARGDRLHIRAPRGLLTPERRELLRQHKGQLLAWLTHRRDERAIVTFTLAESPDCWPVCIGAAGASYADLVASLRRRYGERLIEVRPYRPASRK